MMLKLQKRSDPVSVKQIPVYGNNGDRLGQRPISTNMQYVYSSTEKDRFSLHDCRATSAELRGGRLIFRFPDGFFFKDYSDDWPNTGKAEVEFAIDPMRGVTVYLFEESKEQTIRRECSLEQMIEKINRREWELEFAYRYDGYEEVLYKCWIWENSEPWTFECELWIGTKEDTVFRWDPPAVGMK